MGKDFLFTTTIYLPSDLSCIKILIFIINSFIIISIKLKLAIIKATDIKLFFIIGWGSNGNIKSI